MLLPHGARIRAALERALRQGLFICSVFCSQYFILLEYRTRDFDEVVTPQIFDASLWKQSGHWQHYRNDMFRVVPGSHHSSSCDHHDHEHEHEHEQQQQHEEMYLKPMNCPAHCVMFAQRGVRSHRELPLRFADFGALHRNELKGTLRFVCSFSLYVCLLLVCNFVVVVD